MTVPPAAPSIVRIARLDLAFEPGHWAFAEERRAEIDAHFARRQRETPALWNGRVLVLHRYEIADDAVFRGAYLETDFASFLAWRDWGSPDPATRDCFACAAVIAADGGILLGVMAAGTSSAGAAYFFAGMPDPADVAGHRVDLDRSMAREFKEETGFDVAAFDAEPGWVTVFDRTLIGHVKILRSNENAEPLRARILLHLASQQEAELADVRIVRRPGDIDGSVRPFVAAFLTDFWE